MKAVNGPALRLKRIGAGLTIKELAARVDCDPTTLTKIELGQRNPSLDLLGAVTRALGCTADDLMRAS